MSNLTPEQENQLRLAKLIQLQVNVTLTMQQQMASLHRRINQLAVHMAIDGAADRKLARQMLKSSRQELDMLDQLIVDFLEDGNALMISIGGYDASETMATLRKQHCEINNIVDEQLRQLLEEYCPDEPWRESLDDAED